MRTKPILKLIRALRFHINKNDSFKVANDIRNVIPVMQHFQGISNKMTRYPDMDVSKKVISYTDDLQKLLHDYPAYPDFNRQEEKQFIHDLLKIYYFIYFDMQNKCEVKEIDTTVKNARTSSFKQKWQVTEDQLKKKGNIILDARFVSDANFTPDNNGTLIIEYLPKAKIKATFK